MLLIAEHLFAEPYAGLAERSLPSARGAGQVGSSVEQWIDHSGDRFVRVADDPGRDRQAVVVEIDDVGRPKRGQRGRGRVKETVDWLAAP